jgi:hypothetical protein
MLYFLVLFLTSWSISLWFGQVTIKKISYPFLSVTVITLLIAVLLAAARSKPTTRKKMRKLQDRKVVEVVTRPDESRERTMPNFYYWGLIVFESLLILSAYTLKYIETAP